MPCSYPGNRSFNCLLRTGRPVSRPVRSPGCCQRLLRIDGQQVHAVQEPSLAHRVHLRGREAGGPKKAVGGSQVQKRCPGRKRRFGHGKGDPLPPQAGYDVPCFLYLAGAEPAACGILRREVPSRAVGIQEAEGKKRGNAAESAHEAHVQPGLLHLTEKKRARGIVAHPPNGKNRHGIAKESFHVMADDVQLAVVFSSQEPAAPALLPAKRFVPAEGKEASGAYAAGSHHPSIPHRAGPKELPHGAAMPRSHSG